MKFIILSMALVACVMADVSELGGYDYHGPAVDGGDYVGQNGYSSSVPSNSYIPPAAPSNSYIPPAAPSNSYIPPAAPANTYIPPAAPSNTYIPPAAPSNTYIPPATGGTAELGDDGYRYKSHRHRVHRQRL